MGSRKIFSIYGISHIGEDSEATERAWEIAVALNDGLGKDYIEAARRWQVENPESNLRRMIREAARRSP